MTKADATSVGVYIDFDNVIISRGDQARREGVPAEVSLDAVLDFATKYGRVTISRAYADWSSEKNAVYRRQLVDRAVDLTQLFPAAGTKNGADIRMSIDVIEDLYRHEDLTHVVIVAGDSDYVPLAQRIRRLGREVIGIGVAGSISRTLASACDEYRDYDELLRDFAEDDASVEASEPTEPIATASGSRPDAPRLNAGRLLVRALRLLSEQHEDREWHALGAVKTQILRMEPGFQEKPYGFASFSDLVKKYNGQIEVKDNKARLRPAKAPVEPTV